MAVKTGNPVATDAFVEKHALQVVIKKKAKGLARPCTRVPDKQAAPLIVTTHAIKKGFLAGRAGARHSRKACQSRKCRAVNPENAGNIDRACQARLTRDVTRRTARPILGHH